MISRKQVVNCCLVYVIGYVFVCILVGQLNLPTYRRLMKEGRQGMATVTRLDCSNHMTFFYEIEVEGSKFDGHSGDGFGNRICDELKPGDKVIAYYLPSDPRVNLAGEINKRWHNELMAVFVGGAWVSIMFIVAYLRWEQQRTRAAAA